MCLGSFFQNAGSQLCFRFPFFFPLNFSIFSTKWTSDFWRCNVGIGPSEEGGDGGGRIFISTWRAPVEVLMKFIDTFSGCPCQPVCSLVPVCLRVCPSVRNVPSSVRRCIFRVISDFLCTRETSIHLHTISVNPPIAGLREKRSNWVTQYNVTCPAFEAPAKLLTLTPWRCCPSCYRASADLRGDAERQAMTQAGSVTKIGLRYYCSCPPPRLKTQQGLKQTEHEIPIILLIFFFFYMEINCVLLSSKGSVFGVRGHTHRQFITLTRRSPCSCQYWLAA